MDVNNVNNIPTQVPAPVSAMPKQDPNGLSLTALIIGICSLVFVCCGGGIVLGALGIILALLSRGASTMNSQAKVGLGLSIGALALSMIIVPIMLASYLSAFDSQDFKDALNQELERRYSETHDDIYQDWETEYDDLFDSGEFNLEGLEDALGDT